MDPLLSFARKWLVVPALPCVALLATNAACGAKSTLEQSSSYEHPVRHPTRVADDPLCIDLAKKLHDEVERKSECDTCVSGANGDDDGCHAGLVVQDECDCTRGLNENMGASVSLVFQASDAFFAAGCPASCPTACPTPKKDFHCGTDAAAQCVSWCTDQ